MPLGFEGSDCVSTGDPGANYQHTLTRSCTIASSGPLTHVVVSPNTNCQVFHQLDRDSSQHYSYAKSNDGPHTDDTKGDGECGTFVATGPSKDKRTLVWAAERGRVVFEPKGEVPQTIKVPVLADEDSPEALKKFYVDLSAPPAANLPGPGDIELSDPPDHTQIPASDPVVVARGRGTGHDWRWAPAAQARDKREGIELAALPGRKQARARWRLEREHRKRSSDTASAWGSNKLASSLSPSRAPFRLGKVTRSCELFEDRTRCCRWVHLGVVPPGPYRDVVLP